MSYAYSMMKTAQNNPAPTPEFQEPDRFTNAKNHANELSKTRLREMAKATAKRWTPARRKEKSLIIQKHKPWLRATGPRTVSGKARVSYNAYKHGCYTAIERQLHEIIQAQNCWVRIARVLARMQTQKYITDPALMLNCIVELIKIGAKKNSHLQKHENLRKIYDARPKFLERTRYVPPDGMARKGTDWRSMNIGCF